MRYSERRSRFETHNTMALTPRQAGSVLVVTLMLLTVVLMIGTEMATDSWIAHQLVRNSRDKMVARHAAELALIDVETQIDAGLPLQNALTCCHVELIPDDAVDHGADRQVLYRITSAASSGSTRVVIESTYRKQHECDASHDKKARLKFGRLSWREVSGVSGDQKEN